MPAEWRHGLHQGRRPTNTSSRRPIASAGSSALVQFVHAHSSSTALASSPNPSQGGQAVTFTATVTGVPANSGTPTGMVTFQDGNTVLAQAPLNGSGVASFGTSALALG